MSADQSGAVRIAVIGAGTVGTNLARRFTELGHEVVFGARDVASDKVLSALALVRSATAADIAGAVDGAQLVVLAVPAQAAVDVVTGLPAMSDAIVVDATNDLSVSPGAGSHYDRIVRAVGSRPGVSVVKAFNTIGAEAVLEPTIDGERLFLPIAGPSPAVEVVRELAEAIGFDAVVVGGPDAVPHVEAHALLWIHLAFRAGLGRGFGFVRRSRS